MSFEQNVMALARSQHGLVAWRQINQLGFGHGEVCHRIDKGLLERVTSRVLRVPIGAGGRSQRAMAAILHAGDGAVLSHSSAAAWWRISGFTLDPVHVSIERNRRWVDRTDDMVIHHATLIPEGERTCLDGLPIASPALTLLQVAAMVPPSRLEAAIDSAWSLRLVDLEVLQRVLDRMAQRGRNGVVAFREILEERSVNWSPPQSNLESRFLQLARSEGLGRFDAQVWLRSDTWAGRVDFKAVDIPLVIEVQSNRYHSALSDKSRDAMRRQEVEGLGYTLVEVWENDLFHAADDIVGRLRDIRRRLLAT